MGHAAFTWKGCAYVAGAIGFMYYLSRAHTGPWQKDGKYELPAKTREWARDVPMFADQFKPDSHPNIHNNIEKYQI